MIDRRLAQRAYGALPVPLQNLAFSLAGLRLRHQRYGREFHNRLAWLRESEWASKEEILRYQDAQLRRTIEHCYATVPYYHALFDRLGIRPSDIREPADLDRLPILTKAEVRANRDQLRSRKYRSSQLVSGLTSGSTGAALEVLYTRDALQFQWAIWWRHRARFGLRLGDPFLTFGARHPVPLAQERPPFWRTNYALSQTYLSIYHLSPQYMSDIVEWLNRARFAFYTGYPSAMAILAGYMEDNGLRLLSRPRCVVAGSDALLPSHLRLLRNVFGAQVTDQYGMAECCVNFARCERGVYHEDYEFGIVEALDNPLDPAGPKRIVATGFANPAFPLLRYETGDLGVFSEVPCECGRASRVVLEIDGRTEDCIRTPDGRRIVGMNQVFKWVPGGREMQIVQTELDRVVVRVVKGSEWGASDEEALLNELRERLGDNVGISIEFVGCIPRNSAGKFRAVISSMAG